MDYSSFMGGGSGGGGASSSSSATSSVTIGSAFSSPYGQSNPTLLAIVAGVVVLVVVAMPAFTRK